MAPLSCKDLLSLQVVTELVEVNLVPGQDPVVGGMPTGESKVVVWTETFVVPA